MITSMDVRHKVLCASGVLGSPGGTGVEEVLRYGPLLPTDGIEFLVRNSHRGRLDQVLPQLLDSGLQFPVVHLAKGVAARLPAPEARADGTRRWRGPGEGRIDFRAVSAAIKRERFAGWVSLEAGPAQRADGPDQAGLHRVLRTLATYD